jgi:hypothetical protein
MLALREIGHYARAKKPYHDPAQSDSMIADRM